MKERSKTFYEKNRSLGYRYATSVESLALKAGREGRAPRRKMAEPHIEK